MDIIYFTIFSSKKVDQKLTDLIEIYKDKKTPLMPLRAITLMTKYNLQEGKDLGVKLKAIEELWVDNSFTISEKEVEKIINN